jgi:hypothetical protein
MIESTSVRVRRGLSTQTDERRAVRELVDQIGQPECKLVLVFCSSQYDRDVLGKELAAGFSAPIAGCTTAGEIMGGDYRRGTLVGVSIASTELDARVYRIPAVSSFSSADASTLAASIAATGPRHASQFGLLMIDGLSMAEERVAAYVSNALPGMPIIGGSAGDDLAFSSTAVYADGRFWSDAAVLCVVGTTLPFTTFRTQHFERTADRMVITESIPEIRRVVQINGMPAAAALAETLGIPETELTSSVFSAHPLMLKIGGEYYVRSIRQATEDRCLDFYCAIDTGLVLTVARGAHLVDNLRATLQDVHERIGDIRLIVGCDCILRRLEIEHKELGKDVAAVLDAYPFVGFSTYGEQFNAVHVNQTLTGVAIGG